MRTGKKYEWMVKPTAQTEWLSGFDIWLWLAFVCGGLGGGTYILATFLDTRFGMLFGWVLVAILKGGAHVVHLGKPFRSWRMFFRLQTSWISRGSLFVMAFSLFGMLHTAPLFLTWLPWQKGNALLTALSLLFAFLVMAYPGFTMSCLHSIPLWNNSLVPVLSITYGLAGGTAVMVLIESAGGLGQGRIEPLVAALAFLLMVLVLFLGVFLMSARYGSPVTRYCITRILHGVRSPLFYLGVVAIGIVLPLMILITAYSTGSMASPLLIFAALASIAGSFSFFHCLLSEGVYTPLLHFDGGRTPT